MFANSVQPQKIINNNVRAKISHFSLAMKELEVLGERSSGITLDGQGPFPEGRRIVILCVPSSG